MYMYFVPQIFIWGTSMYANFVVTITGLNLKTKPIEMKAEEAIALLHDHTEGRHDISGQESQDIEWLIIEQAKQIKELKKALNKKRMDNYSLHDKCDKVVQDSGHLEAEIKELKELLIQINKHCYLGELTNEIKQALNK